MLDSQLIFELKNKYGNIYSVKIKDIILIFRELTFKEHSKILSYRDLNDFSSADLEDIILEYTIVFPENYDTLKIPPGNVTSLANEILDISINRLPTLGDLNLEFQIDRTITSSPIIPDNE